jgi:SAM-dependent methyltransferase
MACEQSEIQAAAPVLSDVAAAKTVVLADIIAARVDRSSLRSVLVVGCGRGQEAGILARYFSGANTIGIDIGAQFEFHHEAAAPATLVKMDAHQLEFEPGSFDLVYSFHALEHMREPRKVLSEMARVLAPSGTFCVGTPNKSRLVGYIGSPASFSDKVRWNLTDLKYRLTGRWENASGAHAGFSASELLSMCRLAFGRGEDVSEQYYGALYRKSSAIQAAIASPLGHLIMPCCYIIGAGDQRSRPN